MNLTKFLPLTETTFYIMLALKEAAHGYAVMQKVESLSDGKVRIAAGTMYGALDNLTKQKLIESVKSEDSRRKVYKLTDMGNEVLQLETMRLRHIIKIAEEFGF
ncbi:PadR family transcriptional regulator [Clostridium sp. CX1]|uniref:PadR family transcriptional regulator n=1 Tax=Clostridium tanneri TaxID=3037988 RepID=A0ABU4JY19_9CLOT|nr:MULTISPECIES: PadR family transcriptional regulator [unclassified Clostridium]MCT8975070.1 PadR family transcriptional regulator [Clostridium sp. CX1]MDW8803064.1 PadR family transcriptional regulator [Clostridium sp. A1-XYC3]